MRKIRNDKNKLDNIYVTEMKNKKCIKCNIIKPLEEFYKRNKTKDGRFGTCKMCAYKYVKENRKSRSKKEIKKDKEHESKHHIDKKIQTSEYHRKRYIENKEEIDKRNREYYHENKEKEHERSQKYYYNHQEETAMHKREYRERMRKNHPYLVRARMWRNNKRIKNNKRIRNNKDIEFDKEYFTEERLIQMQKETPNCPVCKIMIDYSLGSKYERRPNRPSLDRLNSLLHYVIGNVNIICYKCNTIKGDAVPSDFKKIINWMIKIKTEGQSEIINVIKDKSQLDKDDVILKKAIRMRGIKSKHKHFDSEYFTIEKLINMQLNDDKCPICEVTFEFGVDNLHKCSSLDRFDSTKGYTKDNVNLICKRCNTIKNNATLKELIQIYNWFKSKWDEQIRLSAIAVHDNI